MSRQLLFASSFDIYQKPRGQISCQGKISCKGPDSSTHALPRLRSHADPASAVSITANAPVPAVPPVTNGGPGPVFALFLPVIGYSWRQTCMRTALAGAEP